MLSPVFTVSELHVYHKFLIQAVLWQQTHVYPFQVSYKASYPNRLPWIWFWCCATASPSSGKGDPSCQSSRTETIQACHRQSEWTGMNKLNQLCWSGEGRLCWVLQYQSAYKLTISGKPKQLSKICSFWSGFNLIAILSCYDHSMLIITGSFLGFHWVLPIFHKTLGATILVSDFMSISRHKMFLENNSCFIICHSLKRTPPLLEGTQILCRRHLECTHCLNSLIRYHLSNKGRISDETFYTQSQ